MTSASAHLRTVTLAHIAELRKAHGGRGWQSALARAAGMSRSHVSKIVSTKFRSPSAEACRALLAVTVDALRAPKDARPAGADREIVAIGVITALPDDARKRVLAWAVARWGSP